MADIEKNNKYIDLQIEGLAVKVEKADKFENSYYSFEYERAFRALLSILQEDEAAYSNGNYNKDESYNIIAFVGTRGSGKSSAMESFAGALSSLHDNSTSRKSEDGFSNIFKSLEKYFFYTLPSIDGSLLESKEDIFKVALGQMYGELVSLNEKGSTTRSTQRMLDYQKREVQKLFVELYRSACNIDNPDGNIEEATITSLKDLSNSLKLRRAFKNLIRPYLNLISQMGVGPQVNPGDARRSYLVISIDDLDMNIRNGYEMLEKIHRYLMVPGVIILMSMDLIQLKMLCEGSFYEMVPKVDKILKQRQGHISKLATEYTDKVLPIGSRIYMPDFKHRTNLRISYKEDSRSNDKPAETKSLKQYFFTSLYRKSGMRFDHRGKKWHFYIPETMRGTVSFYLMLDQIDDLARLDDNVLEWDINDWTLLKSNYTYLVGDIQNRMAVEKLNSKQYQQFQVWADNQLERTCMTVAKHVANLAKRGDDEEKERLGDFRKDYLDFEYSYGELLRSLYLWGRTKNSNKKIVHCILADLTAKMTRSYYEMLQDNSKKNSPGNPKSDSRSDFHKDTLRFILNGSMLGSWSNRMLPEFEEGVSTSFKGTIGALRGVNASEIRFQFSMLDISDSLPETLLDDDQEVEKYRRIFRTMEFFALFFTERVYKNTPTMSWKLSRLKDDDSLSKEALKKIQNSFLGTALSPRINIRTVFFESGYPVFNMYGFMANLFDWTKQSIILEETLYDCLFIPSDKWNDDTFRITDSYTEIRQKFLKKLGIQDEMINPELFTS